MLVHAAEPGDHVFRREKLVAADNGYIPGDLQPRIRQRPINAYSHIVIHGQDRRKIRSPGQQPVCSRKAVRRIIVGQGHQLLVLGQAQHRQRLPVGSQPLQGDVHPVLAAYKGNPLMAQIGQIADTGKDPSPPLPLEEAAVDSGNGIAQHHHRQRIRQLPQGCPVALAGRIQVRLAAYDQHTVHPLVHHGAEIVRLPLCPLPGPVCGKGRIAQQQRVSRRLGRSLELREHGGKIGVCYVRDQDTQGHALPVHQSPGQGIGAVAMAGHCLLNAPALLL